jgi:hypothetical protein
VTACGHELVRTVPVEPVSHEQRQTIQGEESESGQCLRAEEALVQWPEIRRTRRNHNHAFPEVEGASQELGRMNCEMQDGFGPGCGINLAPAPGEKVWQTEGCEESSPCLSSFCCGGSLQYGRPLLSRSVDREH